MKKLFFIMLAVCLVVGFGSCGGLESEPETLTGATTASAPASSGTAEPSAVDTEISSIPTTQTTKDPTTSGKPSSAAPTKVVLPTVKPEDSVTLTTQSQSYPVGTEEITATWHNRASEDMIYGAPFQLQKWDSGQWTEMEPIDKLLFLLWGAILRPGESGEVTYDVGHYYGPLQAGRYRIAALYNYDSERPVRQNDPRHEVFAEFTVK